MREAAIGPSLLYPKVSSDMRVHVGRDQQYLLGPVDYASGTFCSVLG